MHNMYFKSTEHLCFTQVEDSRRKTAVVLVLPQTQTQSDPWFYALGVIKFWPAWRKYAFFPNQDTLYDKACLETIGDVLDELTAAWREGLKTRKG